MKNEYYIDTVEDIVTIYMNSKGNIVTTIIDLEDFNLVNEFKNTWYPCWSPITRSFYVNGNNPQVNGKRTMSRLHRLIMGNPDGMHIDHINHDTLDNRKSNLRIVTNSENQRNRKQNNKNTSGYTGVSWHKAHKKWTAKVTHNKKQIHLGYFDDREEAKKARDLYVQSL